MLMRRGDGGEAVKDLQRALNRLGALLIVDGDFGTGTEQAILEARARLGLPGASHADDALVHALEAIPDPSPELTAPGVTFIAREEVSSPAHYRRRYRFPVWPTPNSGITIGIGYDLRFATPAALRADWGDHLSEVDLGRLQEVSGTRGSEALLARVEGLEVPLGAAVLVFLGRMLPEHIAVTRSAYPALDALPAARRTALVSLVFNRGGSLAGDRRREMKRIGEHLDAGRLDEVPAELEAMTRLWDPRIERGVIDRRRREARLWTGGFEALQLA